MLRRLLCRVVCALLLTVGLSTAAYADGGWSQHAGWDHHTDSRGHSKSHATSPDVQPATGGPGGRSCSRTPTSISRPWVTRSRSSSFTARRNVTPRARRCLGREWTVTPSSQADYKTRIVVDRPISRWHFNGTVVVEWLNVTGGVDASPDWIHMHDELIRAGYAWVGVSAQAVGSNALKLPACAPPSRPVCGDPVRYGSLTHPGDSYSYDIFSQAGQAIRDNAGTILGGLRAGARARRSVSRSRPAGSSRTSTRCTRSSTCTTASSCTVAGARGAALSQAPQPGGAARGRRPASAATSTSRCCSSRRRPTS